MMTLSEYYQHHPRLISEKSAYLEREFIEKIFYPEFGAEGLKFLDYQKKVYDSNHRRNYYIDFVVRDNEKLFAIELDGYNYHGKLSAKEFEKQEERTNEIIRQGYELIRFSFYKIKNKPMEARRELRQRLSLPKRIEPDMSQHESSFQPVNTIPISKNQKQAYNEKSSSHSGLVLLIILIFALILGVVTYLAVFKPTVGGSRTSSSSQSQKAKDSTSIQRGFINSFVSQYNSSSSHSIVKIVDINISDESSPYYRKTNTYGGSSSQNKRIGVHGYIEESEIWIISCDADTFNHMRIYIESDDHELMKEMVHISVPYFNPKSTDNNERLKYFDTMINNSTTGLFINSINGTYVALRSNDITKYRLNMNTGCGDIYY